MKRLAGWDAENRATAPVERKPGEVVPPPIWRGKAVRIHYITQAAVRPPTFVLMANQPMGVSPAYRRFLSNQLRKRYGFRGTPLRIFTRARADRHKP